MTRELLKKALVQLERQRNPQSWYAHSCDDADVAQEIRAELAKPDTLQAVRAAFRAAGLADGGVESLDDVGPELLWQIAEIRAKHSHTEAEVQKLIYCAKSPRLNLSGFEAALRDVLGVPA